jgi:hypothetical protein
MVTPLETGATMAVVGRSFSVLKLLMVGVVGVAEERNSCYPQLRR